MKRDIIYLRFCCFTQFLSMGKGKESAGTMLQLRGAWLENRGKRAKLREAWKENSGKRAKLREPWQPNPIYRAPEATPGLNVLLVLFLALTVSTLMAVPRQPNPRPTLAPGVRDPMALPIPRARKAGYRAARRRRRIPRRERHGRPRRHRGGRGWRAWRAPSR